MDKKITSSPSLNAQLEMDGKTTINGQPAPLDILTLNEEQQKRFANDIFRIEYAKRQRDIQRVEFDGMTYEQDYNANKNAANAYLWPKQNDDEVRVVTGTTEKKIEVLSNEIMSMNLQAEIVAFDKEDNEIRELGQDMADIVKRTEEIEHAADIDQAALRELLTQRALFIQDVDEYITINGRKPSSNVPGQPEYAKETYRPMVVHRARKMLISGLRVYLGDINVPARCFQTDQPYVVLYTIRSYAEAKTLYQNWERWKYVRPNPGGSQISAQPGDYRMHTLEANEVEEIKLIDPINNEYSIILNGIPMMPKSTALPYQVLPNRRYNMSMIVIKEMGTDFAYGKPPVASAKTLQALNDETLRNLIRKFRQALEPPLGVKKTGKVYSRDIWEPGAVTQGVGADDFSILNPGNTGVTQSEFNLYALIEKKTEEFLGAGALQAGMAEKGEQTAAEIQTLQKNAIKNLGHIVAAYMRYKRDATYLRIFTIVENFTKPVARKYLNNNTILQDVYARFTINEGTFRNGAKGKKIVEFMDRDLEPIEKQAMFEYEKSEEQAGRPTRIRVINRNKLLDTLIFWYVTVTSQQRDGSALSKVMFQDTIKQAYDIANLTGRQLNPDKVINEFEQTWNFKNMFMRNQPQQAMAPGGQQGAGQQVSPDDMNALSEQIGEMERTAPSQAMMEGPKGSMKRPSLEQMV